MIVFDLKCEHNHQFEAWFKSSSAYDEQQAAGHVSCPYCDSQNISKAPMAPNVAAKSNRKPEITPASLSVAQDGPVLPVSSQAASSQITSGQITSGQMVSGQKPDDKALEKLVAEAETVMTKIRDHVEKNCDDVGTEFAEEARKIHYGEAEERGIYGNATQEETQELLDEGIDVLPLPVPRNTDS